MAQLEDLSMEQHWDLIRQKLCRKCIDGDGKGGCRLPVDDTCALETLFPEIVQTVTNVQSNSYQAYVDALRTNICSQCRQQFANGVCRKRDSLECALDRYFPIVIDVIESLKMSAVGSGHAPA